MVDSYGISSISFVDNSLICGSMQQITGYVTIKSGAGILSRGTVLGRITLEDKYETSLLASTDGSEEPSAILLQNVDATSVDVPNALVILAGEVDENKLIFGTGHTKENTKYLLSNHSIYLRNVKQLG
jgi:hypothetical protein